MTVASDHTTSMCAVTGKPLPPSVIRDDFFAVKKYALGEKVITMQAYGENGIHCEFISWRHYVVMQAVPSGEREWRCSFWRGRTADKVTAQLAIQIQLATEPPDSEIFFHEETEWKKNFDRRGIPNATRRTTRHNTAILLESFFRQMKAPSGGRAE